MKMRYGFLIFGFVISTWGLCWYFLAGASWLGIPYALNDSYLTWGDRGTFGDMFGSVNALFSGLAFAGLICTLLVQLKEFKAQREELELTRKAYEGQKGVLEDQQKVMDQQREQIDIQVFESAFFQLFKVYQGRIEALSVGFGSKLIEGPRSFKRALDSIEGTINLQHLNNQEQKTNHLKDAYRGYFNKTDGVFHSYANSLEVLLKYIEHAPKDRQIVYQNIVAGIIMPQEFEIIVRFAVLKENASFKKVLNKYCILDKINKKTLPHSIYYDELMGS